MEKRTKRLSLDYLEAGDSIEQYENSKDYPKGITKKMVLNDAIHIAWPSFIELTLTQLTSMVDLMMVGQLGSWAITSVGLTTQPKFLMMTLFMALNVGVTALVARYKGADKKDKANEVLRHGLIFTLLISIVSATIGFNFAENLVHFMGATEEITLVNGTSYLKIQALGIVFVALTSVCTAALRGVGDSKIAMKYNVMANVVNVVFNYLLIGGNFNFPKLGVVGASLATVIGQVVAFGLAIRAITKNDNYLKLNIKSKFVFEKDILADILKIGIPAMIEQLFMRTGMIIYSRTVSALGTVAFATHNVCMNIQGLSFMIGQGFSVSATSLVGQSIGKKRVDMVKHYSKATQKIGLIVAGMLGIVFMFFGGQIVGLYTNEIEVISQGAIIMMFLAFMQPFQALQSITAGALRGAGDTKTTAMIIFITILIVRPLFAIIMINYLNWGLYGAWFALFADQLLRTILIMARYWRGKWYNVKLKGHN